jgi:hypothetical protein
MSVKRRYAAQGGIGIAELLAVVPNWNPPLFSSQFTAIQIAAPRMGVECASQRDYSANRGPAFRAG